MTYEVIIDNFGMPLVSGRYTTAQPMTEARQDIDALLKAGSFPDPRVQAAYRPTSQVTLLLASTGLPPQGC